MKSNGRYFCFADDKLLRNWKRAQKKAESFHNVRGIIKLTV